MPIAAGYRTKVLLRKGNEWARAIIAQHHSNPFEALHERLSDFNTKHCDPPANPLSISQLVHRCLDYAGKDAGRERDVAGETLERLSPYFHIKEEVEGRHFSGKSVRIDAIVTPREPSEWKGDSVCFGVEFKDFNNFGTSFDTKDYTRWWAQAFDYAHSSFDGYGFVHVFPYNCMSRFASNVGTDVAMFFSKFLGQVGIGELRPSPQAFRGKRSLEFVMHWDHILWCESRGVKQGRYWSMKRKFGSR